MRSRSTALVAVTLATAAITTTANAQVDPPLLAPPVNPPSYVVQPPENPTPFAVVRTQLDANKAVQDMLVEFREAKNEQVKQAARADLARALGDVFDADIERRKNELATIRKQLEQMQKVLQKRIDSKEEIVALRAQVLTSEVEGLGWQGSRARTPSALELDLPPLPSRPSQPSLPDRRTGFDPMTDPGPRPAPAPRW